MSNATLVHNPGFYDGEAPTFSDSGGRRQSYPATMESDNAQATPTIAGEAGTRRCADPSVTHLVGGVGIEETTRLPAGSLPAGTKGVGSQHPNKKKRVKRTRRRGSQRLYSQGPSTQVGIIQPRPAHN